MFCGGSVSDAVGGGGIGCQIGRTSPDGDNARQCKILQDGVRECEAMQDDARRCKTMQDDAR